MNIKDEFHLLVDGVNVHIHHNKFEGLPFKTFI
jgi:hypothetical protein